MKKTLLHLFKNFMILSIPLILISVYTSFNLMGCLSVEYPMWAEEKSYVNLNNPKGMDADMLIIGDSRAKSGVIPSEIRDDGSVYNIAIGGTTSIEMYYAVKNYLKSHAAPSEAVVIFAPYHFCDIDNWGQTLYYDYLSVPELMEAESMALKTGEDKVCYPGFLSDILSFKLRLPNKYLDAVFSSRFGGNLADNRAKFDSVRKDLGYTAFGEAEGNDELNYETHHSEFDLSPLMDGYYKRLLKLLDDNGVKVKILQVPVNQASSEAISPEFLTGFRAYMSEIQSLFPNFSVETEIPVYENSYFGDNNHLNRRGAEKFTREFLGGNA